MSLERLDKLLCSTGRWSRKEVKEMIRQGRVQIDGRAAGRPEEKLDRMSACLAVDGAEVDCSPFAYVMLHKPAGLLSATEDKSQPTVLDLLPPELKRRGLFPVGRLDRDTTGLLLLTDDGDPGSMWISYTWPRWTERLTGRTLRPWRQEWCCPMACTACLPGWSPWGTAPPAL